MKTLTYINAQIGAHQKLLDTRTTGPINLKTPTIAGIEHQAQTQAIRQQLAYYHALKTIYTQESYRESQIASPDRRKSGSYPQEHGA